MLNLKANGEVINVGSDEEITILDRARKIKEVSGKPGDFRSKFIPYESFTGKKYEDVIRRVPDIRRCRRRAATWSTWACCAWYWRSSSGARSNGSPRS